MFLFQFLLSGKILVKSESNFESLHSLRVDCVTVDGTQLWKKGAMTGGHYDSRRAKLTMYKQFLEARETCQKESEALKSVEDQVNKLSSTLAKVLEDKSRFESKLLKATRTLEEIAADDRVSVVKKANFTKAIEAMREKLEAGYASDRILEQRIDLWQKELNGDLDEASQEDIDNMNKLMEGMKSAKNKAREIFKSVEKATSKRNTIKNKLELDLIPGLEDAKAKLQALDDGVLASKLVTAKEEAKRYSDNLEEDKSKVGRVQTELENCLQAKTEVTADLDEARSEAEARRDEYAKLANESEQLRCRLIVKENQMKECIARNQHLRTAGKADIEKAEQMSSAQRKKALAKANKKYAELDKKVNHKAAMELEDLTNKKDAAAEDIGKLESEIRDFEALVERTEANKTDKINFTFSQVSKYFDEVFKILVPTGHSRISFDVSPSQSSQDGENEPVGLSIHVSFNPGPKTNELRQVMHRLYKTHHNTSIQVLFTFQLSGGQKSIVALAFVFALQKCDPVPVYIFDEVDSALDANHREKIAQWLLDRKRPQDVSVSKKFVKS